MKYLVIGGTQFIGRHLISQLLVQPNVEIVMINRGKTVCPFIIDGKKLKLVKCDRLNDRRNFRKILEKLGYFDVVVDFVAFWFVHVYTEKISQF